MYQKLSCLLVSVVFSLCFRATPGFAESAKLCYYAGPESLRGRGGNRGHGFLSGANL